MLIVLAVSLLFVVWSAPSFGPTSLGPNRTSWAWAVGPWLGWALAVAAIVFGLLVNEKGWPQ